MGRGGGGPARGQHARPLKPLRAARGLVQVLRSTFPTRWTRLAISAGKATRCATAKRRRCKKKREAAPVVWPRCASANFLSGHSQVRFLPGAHPTHPNLSARKCKPRLHTDHRLNVSLLPIRPCKTRRAHHGRDVFTPHQSVGGSNSSMMICLYLLLLIGPRFLICWSMTTYYHQDR